MSGIRCSAACPSLLEEPIELPKVPKRHEGNGDGEAHNPQQYRGQGDAERPNQVLVLVANHRKVLPQKRPARLAHQAAAGKKHEAVLQEARVPGRLRMCASARMGVCPHACAGLRLRVSTSLAVCAHARVGESACACVCASTCVRLSARTYRSDSATRLAGVKKPWLPFGVRTYR